ncbi:unnamed protein product, partial [Ixodes hexagonus]
LAGCLKAFQRQIRVPYTMLVFVVTLLLVLPLVHVRKSFRMASGLVGMVGTHAIKVFVPAFVVHATQGINNYIFRRCYLEIMVFSIGTFSATVIMAYAYAAKRVADETWDFRECFIYAIFMCSVERMPLSALLFEEGRYPVIATMMQSEALFNTAITWCLFGFLMTNSEDLYHDVLMFPFRNQILAVILGCIFGMVTMTAVKLIPFGGDSAIVVVICATYFTYYFLDSIQSSGVTGVIVFTLVVTTNKMISCTEMEDTFEEYWGVLFDLTGTFTMFVCATYTAYLLNHYLASIDWKGMALYYENRTQLLCVAVMMLYPLVSHFGYRISPKQAVVLTWMGLKGSYTLSLASLYHFANEEKQTESINKSFLYITSDVVLTQFLNVSLLPYLLRAMVLVGRTEKLCIRNKIAGPKYAGAEQNIAFCSCELSTCVRKASARGPLKLSIFFRVPCADCPDKYIGKTRNLQERHLLAVENVLQIEAVSYSRQHRQGIIQKKTKMALLAALQYSYDKKIYLDMDIIGSLVDVPRWIVWLKELMGDPPHEETVVEDDSASLSEKIHKPFNEKLMDLFEHEFYEVIITQTSLAFVLVLSGLLLALQADETLYYHLTLAVEAAYLVMYVVEVVLMISAYGQKFVNLDNYNKLDLILLASCILVLATQTSFLFINLVHFTFHYVLAGLFILLIAVRFVHAIKYIELLVACFARLVHRCLNTTIYSAYEAGHAIVTGEEEVQKNVWKFVESADLAMEIRGRATLNRLLVLQKLAEIQACTSRYPDIMVAFRSRQASTSILNDLSKELIDMQKDGQLDVEDYKLIRTKIQAQNMAVISEACSLPASYKPIAMLRVIPWITSDTIRQFLAIKIRPVSFAPLEVIVERGEENPIILTYSGILKIEGDYEDRGDGAIPNSTSPLFFFNEGYFVDYMASPACVGELGLITEEPSITRLVAETQINAYIIPRERAIEAIDIFTKPPSFYYDVLSYIARNIGLLVLQTHPKYQTWPVEKITKRLDTFLMPNLENASRFILTADVHDAILIQGVAVDTESQDSLVAPIYVPQSVRRLSFPGIFHHRVRPVLIVIADKRYRLPQELDWMHTVADDDYQDYMNLEFGQERLFIPDEGV